MFTLLFHCFTDSFVFVDSSCLQVMQVSNVSGGFWLQNPLCITNAFHMAPAHMIHLECEEPCQSERGFQHNLADQPDR